MTEFKKPKCKLVGTDGNIYSLMSKAYDALRKAGHEDLGKEMWTKITTTATSYDHAINIICEYVDAR